MLIRSMKNKAIIKLNNKNKKYKFVQKFSPLLIKLVKNLKYKSIRSLKNRRQ